MAKWLQPFSFGSKSYKQSECERPSPTTTPINHKIPYSESENIRESILDFTARFGEIKPDMLYLCRRGQSGLKRAVFAHTLRDLEISTIEHKMSHTESKTKIHLNNQLV